MKKFLTSMVLLLPVIFVMAQNDVKWTRIDSPKEKYDFKYFISTTQESSKAVFTIPQNKPFQQTKHNIFVRSYNSDLSNFTETGIPPDSPVTLFLAGFRNYTVISGSMDENKNPMAQYAKENMIIIADNNMNPLVVKTFPLHGKKNKFTGSPVLYTSHDTSHLIVVNNEILSFDKPSLKEPPKMTYIDVYDKSLNHVWTDSVNFNTIFGEKNNINRFSMDFVDGKLLLTASCPADGMKKIKATIYLVSFDKPQSYKIIWSEIFPYENLAYRTLVGPQGNMIISGANMMGTSAPFGQTKKQLFFLNKDLKNSDAEPVFKSYELDKTFVAKYPEYKMFLAESLFGPFDLFLLGDRVVYASEHRYYSTSTSSSGSSSTTYYFKHITLLCFDNEGQIEWLNMINKSVASKQSFDDHFCNGFVSGNNLCFFYYDYADNIAAAKFIEKPRFVGEDKLWVTQAIVSPDGDIKKTMITNIGAHDIRANLSATQQVNDHRFILVGTGTSLSSLGGYFGIYELDK